MALAYVQFENSDGESCRFTMDLGRNRYYAYAIGDAETFVQNGLRLLSNRVHQSELMGPMDQADDGRSELTIPRELFDREHRSLQLISFRDQERNGPAVSSIVTVELDELASSELPPLTFSLAMNRWNGMKHATAMTSRTRPVRALHARIREQRPLSQTQFLQGLVSLLPSLLPVAGNLIGALMGGASGRSGTGGGTTTTAAALPVIPPELLRFLQQLLSQAGRPAASNGASGPVTAPAVARPTAPTATTASLYSQAMFAPALLAALPALMPLLQQVSRPENIQGVLQTADPNRLIGTISNAIQGIGQLGLQGTQQEMNWLKELNPGVDDPAFNNLLAQMSANLRAKTSLPSYRRINSVKLQFADVVPVILGGRQLIAFVRGRELAFPLSVETSRQIPPGILYVAIKDAKTLGVMAEQRLKTPPLSEGRIATVNHFSAEELSQLKIGEDYLVCAHLVWKNKAGKKIGATATQPITMVGEYTFDSVDESGELIPLNDVDQFRDYWHKAWQGSFSRDLARIEVECKYYYLLEPGEVDNAQVETTLREVEKGLRRSLTRLKTGLLLSPNRLNELLPKISPHPMLNEGQLAALLTPDFVKRVRLAARTRVKFGGRPGHSAALWVFPDVKVHQIVLKKADQIRASGNVISLQPEIAYFPLPALAHFVGVSSE
jgi:hypothetical protein